MPDFYFNNNVDNEKEKKINQSSADYWRGQNEKIRQKEEEYQLDLDKYSVNITQEDYNVIKDAIANAEIPEDEAFRWASALELNQQYGIGVNDAYQNLENINQALWGDRFTFTPKTNFKAIVDSGHLGYNTLKMGWLGSKIMIAESGLSDKAKGTFYADDLDKLLAEYEALEKENESLQDYEDRNFAIEVLKFGGQSLPFTGYVAGMGLLGSLIAPGVGTAASFVASMNNAAGLQYMKLRKAGSSKEAAAALSLTSGALQAIVETSLGNIAGALGKKSVLEKAGEAVSQKITANVFKRLAYDGTMKGLALRLTTEYLKENAEEGLEEVIQDLIEKGTDALAAELGNYEITGLDAKTIARDAWENFRGGVMGSLVLGLPTSAIKVNADVKEFTKVRQLSEVVESQEMFNALTDESPIFRDMTTQEKREAQKTSWENGQARKEARATENAKQIAEGLDAGEGAEERKVIYDENGNEIEEETAESVARDEKGRLFVQDQEYKDDDGKVTGGQFWAGNAEQSGKEAGNRYGYITYSQDENGDITIDTFKMTKGREGLREEMFDQFAQEHPDVKIEWNAIGSDTQAIKQELINANPSGAKNGLSRYTTESLNDPNNAARKRAMAEIGNVIHNIEEVRDTNGNLVRDENGRVKVKRTQLTQQQLAAAVSFVELGAKTISGLSLEEYMNKSYENGRFFGSTQDFINKTLAQGERVDNKNGGIRQGTAQQGWQKDGMIIKNVIYAAENADFATFVHEVAHGFRAQLSGQMLADAEAAFGVKDGNWDGLSKYKYADGSYMTYEEAFAYYAQDYFITGKAPTPQMENIFKRLAQFLAEAYSRLRKHLDISPEIEKVFNELLADDDSVYNKALKAAREQENEYRAKLKRQAEEAKAAKEAEEQEAQKQAELEKEEAGEYTDYEQETTQQSAEEIEAQLEESNEKETGNAIDNALGNLELTDETKNQVAEILKDPTTTTPEKANAIVDAAGEQFDLFQRQEGLLYQLAGEPSIRRMAESQEKERILADLDAAKLLDERYKSMDAKSKAARIRMMTGWEKDATGSWKYETDDSVNRIKGGPALNNLMRTSPDIVEMASKKANLILGDIYDAPELYKVFPYMKNVRVSFYSDPNAFRAVLTPEGIKVNMRYLQGIDGEKGLKGALVHEIQHVVQAMEYAESKGLQGADIEQLYNDMMDAMQAAGERKYDYDLTSLQQGLEAYMNDYGEIEARNVARRVMYNADKRRNITLESDEDVKRKNILFQNIMDANPVGTGDFGPIYDDFKGKPDEAIIFLLNKKEGEAIGALHYKDIGDIDLVYGEEGSSHSDGYGLAKLAKYHPEVLSNLQGILDDMEITKQTKNRVQLESKTHKASIRLTWNGKNKKWLLTAYEKDSDVSDSRTDIAETASSRKNDTATLTNTATNNNTIINNIVNKILFMEDASKRDKEYAQAVESGDTEKAMQMLAEEAERKGYTSNSDYQGTSAFNGAAPYRNGYFETKEARLQAIKDEEFEDTETLGDFAYDNADALGFDYMINDPRAYRAADEKRKEAIDNLRSAIKEAKDGKKNVTIKMYRSVPADIKEGSFRNGDWITPSKSYAEDNADVHSWGPGEYRIIEQDVDLENIWWDGNDIAEWGYDDEKEAVYKNTENNRKLFEITYDENGDLIPLSKRFDENNPNILFQTAYHGSGASFDKFDTENYGYSGEGSMSFGYGTYVTDSEEIARDYANRAILLKNSPIERTIERKKEFLKERKKNLKDTENKEKYEAKILKNLKNEQKELAKAQKQKDDEMIKFYQDLINISEKQLEESERQKLIQSFKDDIENTQNEIKELEESIQSPEGKRHLYTVEIPDDGYIVWDKPVRKQTADKIKRALFNEITTNPDSAYYNYYSKSDLMQELDSVFSYMEGQQLYRNVSAYLEGDEKASKFLRELGYAGLKYPAGTIHGNGRDAYNYVIFNDDDAKIIDHLLFQTNAELMQEAQGFETWQDFMEFCEVMHSDDEISPIPSEADAQWYQSFWETAHGLQTEQEKNEQTLQEKNAKDTTTAKAMDALFTTYIRRNPEMLDDFLHEVARIDAIDLDSDEWRNVEDDMDAAQRDKMDQLKDAIAITMSDYNWQSAMRRIQGGGEISEGMRKRLLGEMTDGFKTRDFRALYAEVMEDAQYAVDEEDTTSAMLSKKLQKYQKRYYDIVKPGEDISRMSPEKRKRIAEAMANRDIANKIRNGSLKLDDELDAYIKSLDSQIKEKQKQFDELEKETKADYQRIADAETRRLLKLHDELLRAKSKVTQKNSDTARKINKGLKITEKYQRASQSLQANYDELFRKFNDLKNTIQITAEVQAALDRQEQVASVREDLNTKQKEKNLTAEVKKMRINLVKRTMRRVPFNRIDYNNAKTVIAIQRFLEPNLIGGVNKFIGIDSPFLRGVISQIVTDSDYKEKILNYLNKTGKASEAFVNFKKKLTEMKSIKDFDSWTEKERKAAIKYLPKENWVKDLNLMELAKEREESIDLDIDTEEYSRQAYDENGKPKTYKNADGIEHNVMETAFRLRYSDELGQLVKDAVGADMFDRIVNRPFSEWTTEELEQLAQRIDELYTEGRDLLAAKNEARKREAEAIRKRVEDAIKETGIVINDDDTPEEKERKQKEINKILNLNSGLKGTEAGKEKGIKAKLDRLIHGYSDMNVLRFARMLDNQSEGENVYMLYRKEDECYNAKTRSINNRARAINEIMKANNITEGDLAQSIAVPQLNTEFTVDELLYFLAADKDYAEDETKLAKGLFGIDANDDWAATSRNAVMFGNMMSDTASQEQKETWAELDKQMKDAIENDTLTTEQKQLLAMGQLDKAPGTSAYINYCHAKWETVLGAANSFIAEHPEYKAFMEAIEADYAAQYERMNEISINEFNAPVHRVKAYVPLVRRESNGETNVNQVKEDLLAAYGSNAGKQWVNKGMTQRRVNISPLNQKPVQTGLFATWGSSVDRTEHFIAYAPYVRQLNAIYKSRDASYTRRFIESRYGKYAVKYLDDYINEVANPNAGRVREAGSEWLHTLRGRTAPAYLGWKFSAIIKQGLTSPWPYMQFVNPAEYASAALECTRKGTYDAIREKSVFMNNRVMDPMNELVEEMADEGKTKFDRALGKFGKKGMAGLEWIDWVCVAPGWLACYKKEYARLQRASEARYDAKMEELRERNMYADIGTSQYMTPDQMEAQARKEIMEDIESEAVRYADDCTRQCQPSSRAADLAPLFKDKSEAMKAFLQFQTSLNVIWQNIRYDMPYAVRNKQFNRIVGTIMGYVFAGIFMNSVMDGVTSGADDDDDKDLQALRNLVFYSTTQFTDAIPIMGSEITNVFDQVITGKRGFAQSGTDMTPSATKLLSALTNASKGNWEKAATLSAEAIGMAAGAPISGLKEINKLLGKPLEEGDVNLKRGLSDVYGIAGDIIEE